MSLYQVLYKRKAFNVTENRVFFCVNSIHYPFVDPELMNTSQNIYNWSAKQQLRIYLETLGGVTRTIGVLYMQYNYEKNFQQLVFFHIIAHPKYMYNWSVKQKLHILKTIWGISFINTIVVPYWQPPARHFYHFNNRIFRLKSPV